MTIIKQENTNFHLQLPKPKVCKLNIKQDKIKFKCICKKVIQEKHDSPIYIYMKYLHINQIQCIPQYDQQSPH